MTLNEKRIERKKVWESMKGMLDLIEKEKRAFTAEEDTKYKAMEADVDRLGTEVQADEQRMLRAKEIEDSFRSTATPATAMRPEPTATVTEHRMVRPTDTPEYRSAFQTYLGTTTPDGMPVEKRGVLLVGSDPGGGYTVPQEVSMDLIKIARNRFVVRSLARTITLTRAESLSFPKFATELGDVTFTAELLTGSEDTAEPFARVTLTPHPMARRARISKTLLRQSALDIEAIIKDALGYSAGRVEENAFLNGSGSNEPLGIFTASALGLDTDRDCSTSNTDTAITADGLIEVYHTLHEAYRPMAIWLFNDEAVKKIRKLKDGEGQYIWTPGIVGNATDTILTRPVRVSAYVPHVFTTGLYVGAFGDFSQYYIVDTLGTTIQTLTELYAATNENGYILRKETDGAPVLSEAFVRVTLA